ncbi:MAG: 30S ribosomal protein S7 [Bacteroidetes bacterium]|nr:30S ribosomal protein S7 [Bacteroidota bacterium]
MRGKQAPKRDIAPDPVYSNQTLAKFINFIMLSGKKNTAQGIVYGAFDIIKKKEDKDAMEIFEAALNNVGPAVEVKTKRVGGSNYQVPIPVKPERKSSLAMRWIINAARAKKGRSMTEKLAEELMLAAKGEGDAMKKRADVHKMAESNRAFAHFAY